LRRPKQKFLKLRYYDTRIKRIAELCREYLDGKESGIITMSYIKEVIDDETELLKTMERLIKENN